MDMVERVARAMCPHPSEYGDFLDWAHNEPEECFLNFAKKAIEAMREPAHGMKMAFNDALPEPGTETHLTDLGEKG